MAGGDAFAESSVEFLHIGAGRNLLKEILPHNIRLGETGELLFIGVVLEDSALSVELDSSTRKRVQSCLAHQVNFLINGFLRRG